MPEFDVKAYTHVATGKPEFCDGIAYTAASIVDALPMSGVEVACFALVNILATELSAALRRIKELEQQQLEDSRNG